VREHGSYFVAYGATLDALERQPAPPMLGLDDGHLNALMKLSRGRHGRLLLGAPRRCWRLDLRALGA